MNGSTHAPGQRGFTLIEMLLVILLIGVMVGIGTFAINSAWQRFRLESTAGNVRTFVQQTFTSMNSEGAPVFLRLVPARRAGSRSPRPPTAPACCASWSCPSSSTCR